MEITFNMRVTVKISDIEGHGVEEEIKRVKQDMMDCDLSGAVKCGRIDSYSIDSVEIAKNRPSFEEVQKKYEGYAILCACGEILHTKIQTHYHWEQGHFDNMVR